MNIINQLTLRTLKKNKKRTIVTIIGVIISVAMITAVATLIISFMNLLQRQVIANDGEWHVLYKDVNQEQLEVIKQDENTKEVLLSKDLGYAYLEGSQNEDKPYLFVKAYDLVSFKNFPIELIDGRLPTSPGEIVISQHIEENGGVKLEVGDTLTLEVGRRVQLGLGEEIELDQSYSYIHSDNGEREKLVDLEEKVFTVVGVIERPNWEYMWAPGYTVITFLDESLISENNPANVSVVLEKVKRSLFEHAEELADQAGIKEVQFNNELLRYYGVIRDDNFNQVLIGLGTILMAIIMVGSVSLIYNAFAISVLERSRHLGMLSSVGATKIQKRNSVFFEGAVIGIISIPLGIIAGLTGIGITLYYINSFLKLGLGVTEDLKLVVSPLSIIIAVVVSVITIFISTYIPAIRASKISAIDAIRQTQDVKLTGKKVRTSKLVRKIFGIEAEIGLKNLKRNKRRYQATVFSLVVSIVLFLTVSYFTMLLKDSYEMTLTGPDYDISVSYYSYQGDDINATFEKIERLPGVTESIIMKDLELQLDADDKIIPEGVEEYFAGTWDKTYYVSLHALAESSLISYFEKIGMEEELIVEDGKIPAIIVDTISYINYEENKFVEDKGILGQVGDTFELNYLVDYETEEKIPFEIEVVGLTDELPFGVNKVTYPGSFHVIVSEEDLYEAIEEEKITNNLYHHLYLKSIDPIKTEEAINELELDKKPFVYNVYQARVRDEQMMTIMAVFVYGFVALITAISVANIFNTISTSIGLRKREFAMLKSVGMTPKGFNKMLNYESIFYGLKSLLYGLPISLGVMFLLYRTMESGFSSRFKLPWDSVLIVILGVFVIVGTTMLYSSSKVKKENIIDALKQENI